ncbi:MAG: IS1595 family transposase [Chthoniobacteraceae bacterium]
MPAHWNSENRPLSLHEFEERFPDDDTCADYLEAGRWPGGFVCPHCGCQRGWKLLVRQWTWECRDCGRQTSVTSGTVMHGSKVPLKTWFLAAHLVATHSNGMSALQLHAKLGLGSYKTACLLLQKLRRAMIDPMRSKLSGAVEVDETVVPFYPKKEAEQDAQAVPPIGRLKGKIAVMGAVELLDKGPGRIRLEVIADYSPDSLKEFIVSNIKFRTELTTDGFASYANLLGFTYKPKKSGEASTPRLEYTHKPIVISDKPAHEVLPWIHRVFANLKRWALGVYHGFRKKYLDAYLNEFVFRWNRRHSYKSAFERLIGIGLLIAPATSSDIRSTAYGHPF